MNVGVIGSDGFVGRNLVLRLRAKGASVSAYGRKDVDLLVPESLQRIEQHDAVVNCAAYVGADRGRLLAVNVHGVLNLCAEMAGRTHSPYLLNISSGAVYGYADTPAVFDGPIFPVGDYALSKYLGDEALRLSYKGASATARLYYPYGEGQAQERLMPRLVSRVLNNEPINISFHGAYPLINPIHIDDLCEELFVMVSERVEGGRLLGGDEIVSVRDIALLAGRIIGADPVFNFFDGPSSSMYCEGRSSISLESGLYRLIDSMRGA